MADDSTKPVDDNVALTIYTVMYYDYEGSVCDSAYLSISDAEKRVEKLNRSRSEWSPAWEINYLDVLKKYVG